jgi:hypothetical protein
MKNDIGGNIVVLTSGQIIDLPFIHGSKENSTIIFRRGAIGKVMGTLENKGVINRVTIEFNLCYGVAIQIDVSPDCIESASGEQVSCYCGYNSQVCSC